MKITGSPRRVLSYTDSTVEFTCTCCGKNVEKLSRESFLSVFDWMGTAAEVKLTLDSWKKESLAK